MANHTLVTRESILDAAEQVVKRFGPAKSSVVDVARALGVSHGTVYRYFKSKAELRDALTDRWLRDLFKPLEEIVNQSFDSTTEQLRVWLRSLIEYKRQESINNSEMFELFKEASLEEGEMIKAQLERLILQMASIIKKGVEKHELRVSDSVATAHAIFLATRWLHSPLIQKWNDPSFEEDFESVWTLIISGILER